MQDSLTRKSVNAKLNKVHPGAVMSKDDDYDYLFKARLPWGVLS